MKPDVEVRLKDTEEMEVDESFEEVGEEDILYESDDKEDCEQLNAGYGNDYDDDTDSLEEDKPFSRAKESTKYEVLGISDILEFMSDTMISTNALLQLSSPTTVRILLNHFGWDKEKLCESYFAGGDEERDQLFRKVRLENPLTREGKGVAGRSSIVNGGDEEECENCLVMTSISKMHGMKCGHRFCLECWMQYLTNRIGEEGTGRLIFCLAYDCNFLLEDDTVLRFVKDSYSIQLKYRQQIINGCVQSHKHIKWCPSPDCIYAVKTEKSRVNDDDKPVTCKCGHTFCFECTAPAHTPISCVMLKEWLKLETKDLLSSAWIAANTKDCPKCKAPIEKNGGCNFILCPSCRSEFCWICMAITYSHQHSTGSLCNVFNEGAGENLTQDNDKLRAARYNFYYHRYISHRWSHQMENKLYDIVKERLRKAGAIMVVDPHFSRLVLQAIDTLQNCRQTLMYTSVFANFVLPSKKNSQIEIFEKNHEYLHEGVEKLSNFLETKLWEDLEMQKPMLHVTFDYCENRRKVLIDHVREGEEKGFWKFQD